MRAHGNEGLDPTRTGRWSAASPADRTGRDTLTTFMDLSDRFKVEGRQLAPITGLLDLQRLIADLAARFVTIEAGAIDDTVVDGMRQVGELLQLDRIILRRDVADDTSGDGGYDWIKSPPAAPPLPWPLASVHFVSTKLEAGEAVWFTRAEDLPDEEDRAVLQDHGIRSAVAVPVTLASGQAGRRGVLAFCSASAERDWTPAVIAQLRIVAGVFGQAVLRKVSHQKLQRALDELHDLRERVTDGGALGRPAVSVMRTSRLIVSESASVRQALAQVEQVAPAGATVLLLGETGVGKEVFAQAIHELSPRHHRPMIRVSCGAIPSALIESELFGRERGAYTGALTRQIGRFEAANQSTLFLDEIGELSPDVQVKLLRVLQERVVERLGSTQTIKVDVRIIAATNKNLEKAVEDKGFREDLFYRLNVFPIVIPPLRDRIEDIPGLVWEFVDEFSKSIGKTIESISEESMRQLQLYSWPGNVRELRNVIERAVIVATGPKLTVLMPQRVSPRQVAGNVTLRNLELDHIRGTLESTHWRIRGHGGAAERLGLKPTTLEGRMAKLGLVRPKHL